MTDMDRASAMAYVESIVRLSPWDDNTGWLTKIYGITVSAFAWQEVGTCVVGVCADLC